MSDTHGAVKTAKAIIEKEQPACIYHLGDCVKDIRYLQRIYPDIHFEYVAGNCDYNLDVPDSRFLDASGIHVFITHGHIYNVKYSFMRLIYAAQEVEANIVLFGHTHSACVFEESGIQFMNPGAANQGYYGIISIEDGVPYLCSKKL